MALPDGHDVQGSVDDLAELLGQPVLIEDVDARPLWWSAQGAADGTRIRTFLRDAVDPAAREMMRRLKLATAKGAIRTPALPEIDMRSRWCQPLRIGPTLVGYLWIVDDDDHLEQAARDAITACARRAETALADTLGEADSRQRRRRALLERLREAPDEDAAAELVVLEGISPEVTVVVLDQHRGRGWELSDHLWVQPDPLPGLVAASGAPLPLVRLGLAVRRAVVTRKAMAAGATPDRPSYDALGLWQLVAAAPDDLQPEDIHPGVAALRGLTRPELLQTTETLLRTGGDIIAASEQLHVHRTTLYYRIERVAEVAGVDLRGDPRLPDLDVALKLARYRATA